MFDGLPPRPVRGVELGSGVCGGGVGYGAPRDGLEFFDASIGVARHVGFSRYLDQEGMPEYGGVG